MTLVLLAALALAEEPTHVDHIALTGREAIVGNPTAPWTIVQYSDWQCPHCAHAFARLDEYIPKNPDVRVVFKTYPLTSECNPTLTVSNGPARCTLAAGGVCANEQGHWLDYARWAFGNQATLGTATVDTLVAAAGSLGLNAGQFGACVRSTGAKQVVEADAVEGGRLALQGTPSFFVLDRAKHDWLRPDDGVDGAIAALDELRQHGVPPGYGATGGLLPEKP